MHADHVTGSGSLKKAHDGCRSVISKQSKAKADLLVEHEQVIECGSLKLQVRATPGHTDGRFPFYWFKQA